MPELAAPPVLDAAALKARARELGFDACGITAADPAPRAEFYRTWLADGRAGEMQWMGREPDRRGDPRVVLPGARSLVVVGLNYWQPQPAGRGRIARYALGDDYHAILQEKLEALAAEIRAAGAQARVYVDTGPILEKPLAARAGLGWQGKSTMLIHRDFGPWLLLGEIVTTLDLAPDAPAPDRCGTCSRCVDACPTGAITAPLPTRCAPLHRLPDHRAEGLDSRGVAAADRRPGLRLRRVSRCVPVESFRADHPRGALFGATGRRARPTARFAGDHRRGVQAAVCAQSDPAGETARAPAQRLRGARQHRHGR